MINGIKKAVAQLYPRRASAKQIEAELIRREAAIGASIFGAVPEGHIRRFVCLDTKTIVWYESVGPKGQPVTTRYELAKGQILKAQDGQRKQPIALTEARTLLQAMRWYYYLVAKNLYGVSL